MKNPPRFEGNPGYPDPAGLRVLRWWDGTAGGDQPQPLPPQGVPGPVPPPAAPAPARAAKRLRVPGIVGFVAAALVISVAVALILSHVSSGPSSSAGGSPPPSVGTSAFQTQAQGAPSSAADQAAPSSSPAVCTSHACVVRVLQQSLPG